MDSLDNTSGRFHAMKPVTSKTAVQRTQRASSCTDDVFYQMPFKLCLECEVIGLYSGMIAPSVWYIVFI